MELNYGYSSIKLNDLKKYETQINEIVNKFNNKECLGNDYIGWYDYPFNIKDDEIEDMIKTAEDIRNKCDVFVVCGIGGSYLGARAVIESVKGFVDKEIEIVYFGNTFDERYLNDVVNYLKDKEFCVNVISKSGSTLETALAFRMLKQLLEEKYGEEAASRIYATTDETNGCLRQMTEEKKYKSYVIPQNVGGRYSVFTPVGLLPVAVAGVNIKELLGGAKDAIINVVNKSFEENIACQYAAYRYHQYINGNKIELFTSYSPYLSMVSEWWKQLFGESEGKENKGLFPASVNFSTDLHSLGQFVQEGSKVLFITQIKVLDKGVLKIKMDNENMDNLNYLGQFTFAEINLKAQEGTNTAHYNIGGVDNLTFEIEKINEFNVGKLLYIFMYSCMISAGLLEVNAFNQPGVEFYKAEMKKLLKN